MYLPYICVMCIVLSIHHHTGGGCGDDDDDATCEMSFFFVHVLYETLKAYVNIYHTTYYTQTE
jgi:hypothetical protein